ncbi:MAG TPA: hypothetical protein VEH04_07750 [Verrucomicrobiae bacterium]|nr:hypothetical protein [Verrucomicrobiae bacterium]
MKAFAASSSPGAHVRNFYTENLAPVNHHEETQFRGWDAALLVVLFLEVAILMRLVLAT